MHSTLSSCTTGRMLRRGPTGRVCRAALCLLLTIGTLFGPTQGHTQPGPQAPLRSAAEIDYPPFSIVEPGGHTTGFSVELLRAALGAMGREVTFCTGPWEQVRGWLERGDVAALPLVGRTPEREALFDFTFPYMSLHGAIVVRRDAANIRDLEDLRGRTVAVMSGDNAEEFLRREDRGIDLRTTATFEVALTQLAAGRHDAVVVQRLVALRLLQETGLSERLRVLDHPIQGFRQDFCFAVREGDRGTLALLNEGLAIVMADGTYRRLHAEWFAALELPGHRPILVGGDRNFPPFEFLDENGHPAGYNVELTRAIAREMGLEVEIRLGPWPAVRAGLAAGELDVVQGMLYSPERDRFFDFTQAHTVSHQVAVVRRGEGPAPESPEALAGQQLVVEREDIMHDFAREQGLEAAVTAVADQETALRELAEGRHDCALVSRVTALYLIEKHGWANLVVGRRPLFAAEYAFAVAGHGKALLAQFGEGLKALEENGEYRRIYEKWLGVYQPQPPPLWVALRYSAWVILPLMGIVAAAFLWSWSLRRKVAERTRELRASEEFQRAMIACSPVALYAIDLEGDLTMWNVSAERVFGWRAEEVLGKPLPIVPADRREEFEALRRRLLAEGHLTGVELERQRKGGARFLARLSAAPIRGSGDRVIGIMGSVEDITERARAEAALRDSEARFRLLAETAPVGIVISDREENTLYVSQRFVDLFGYTRDDMPTVREWWALAYPDPAQRDRVRAQWAAEAAGAIATRSEIHPMEAPVTCRDGRERQVEFRMTSTGELNFITFSDVSERHSLEEQLRQAQKMEAVGRLAGGVAHDFNNMLTIILGNAELALEETAGKGRLSRRLTDVLEAGQRSADITRQLLAFARKQTIQPRVLDLNESVDLLLKMLRRLIGEDLDLAWLPGPELWPVKLDPSQLDQVLANLCLNARDAVAGVGKITIETANAIFDEEYCRTHIGFHSGEFVLLAVSDNGRGMDEATRRQVFEPFFTTKGPHQGTGLGLATVYGIVKQNAGFINVYSEPGMGTTFKMYLPHHAGAVTGRDAPAQGELPRGAGQSVLLVEDETAILPMIREMLESLGYHALTAATPGEALGQVREAGEPIDLLLTDVVLPEMNGRDLAERARAARPELRVVFMSGYTANVIAHHGVLDEGVRFLQKPFSKRDLAVALERAFAESPEGVPGERSGEDDSG
ncbi:MAG: transporter substrate-binding domain-containing protein [Deferrisomatales bacterium]|nr:transporter substrate-binding domain-containing protein [Deferrisomatales bacterium]